MQHQEVEELLSLYIDDQLSRQEQEDFEGHIKDCPACAQKLQQTIAVMNTLKNLEPVLPPYDIAKAVTKELTKELTNLSKDKKFFRTKLLRFSSIAAAFIVMIVFAIYNNGSSIDSTMSSSKISASKPLAVEQEQLADADTGTNDKSLRNSQANYSAESAKKKIQMQSATTSLDKFESLVQRKLIQSATLQISIVEYKSFLNKVTNFLNQNSGYIENTNLYKNDQTKKYSAELSIRIPDEKFQPAINFLQQLGDLKSLNIGSQDVSMQYIDNAAKIKTYDTQISALQSMLGKAKKVDEMLQVQNELTRVQAEHDSLVSQNKYIDRSASYATINLSVREEKLSKEKVMPTQNNDVLSKAKAGLILSINNLISQAQNLFIELVTIIPQLLIAFVVILIGVLFAKIKYKK